MEIKKSAKKNSKSKKLYTKYKYVAKKLRNDRKREYTTLEM